MKEKRKESGSSESIEDPMTMMDKEDAVNESPENGTPFSSYSSVSANRKEDPNEESLEGNLEGSSISKDRKGCDLHANKAGQYVETVGPPDQWKYFCSGCAVDLAQKGRKLFKISKSTGIYYDSSLFLCSSLFLIIFISFIFNS